MPKQRFERTRPHVNIGTIGHVDHNMTTLTEAISKYLSEHGYDESYNVPKINDKGITVNPSIIEEIEEGPKVKTIGKK